MTGTILEVENPADGVPIGRVWRRPISAEPMRICPWLDTYDHWTCTFPDRDIFRVCGRRIGYCECPADFGEWGAWRSIVGQVEARNYGTVFVEQPRLPESERALSKTWEFLEASGVPEWSP